MNASVWKSVWGVTLAVAAAGQALAAEQAYGKVISKSAVYVQVSVPQRQCVDQEQTYQPPPSGAGAVIGAVAGGAAGNAVGSGAGKAVATGLGVLAGAVLGDRAEANATPPRTMTVRSCQNVTQLENRFMGYDVTYEYRGQRYTARVPSDPGDRVALKVNVSPVDAAPPSTSVPQEAAVASPPPVYYPSGTVVYGAPAVVYGPPPVYWGPSVGVNLGWGWGYRHWR